MEKKKEKMIVIQTSINIGLLGNMVKQLESNPDVTLRDFFEDWEKSIKWDQKYDYAILNQGVILTHLYGLIVYPKESFYDQIPKKELSYFNKNDWGNYEILSIPTCRVKLYEEKVYIKSKDELTLEFLIRKLRNALSHGNIRISNSMDYVFEDEDKTRIKFTISGLQQFVQKFGQCCISEEWV